MIAKLIFIIALFVHGRGLELKQVIVLSRHNIRTPLTTNLELLTPKNWPDWNGDTGHLTPKGSLLERAMGKYFSDWMIEKKLLKDNCSKDQVFAFSNTRSRTVETAKSFVEGAFGDCVEVNYKNITEMDPVFNPIVRNDSEEYRKIVTNEMQLKLNDLKLGDTFKELNKIVHFEESSYCKQEMICDLSKLKNEIFLQTNMEPDVLGALKIGNTLVDAFLMAYYDGMAPEDVAWGKIQNTKQWEKLMTIVKKYHNIRFQTKPCDRDEASTLLEYLTGLFQSGTKKFYILVGHDANILSLKSSLNFKDYELPGQFENTPIGGKIVFQKWHDSVEDQDLLRVQYVYQSSQQIREGAEASLDNPPQWAMLELEDCFVDERGFCPWDNFIRIFKSLSL